MDKNEEVSLSLRKIAGSNDNNQVAAAMRDVRRSGKAALPILIDALHGEDPMLRDIACAVLGELGPDAGEAVPRLLELMKTGSEETRMATALSLMRIGPDSLSLLEETAKETAGLTKFWACWAISWLDPSRLNQDMIACLKAEQEQPTNAVTPFAAEEAISKVIAWQLKEAD
ncbi:sporulation killing factor biosynthesis and export [Niallia circulans]|jgi:HEAT repeat protein|uniref:HEAT repeat domain-containing protein n=1 Tax=Shouchella clausii TaxID=79880 RepID=UPI000BA607E7|nr:HEAT repeat domain-containing protein [Shouchella clausii]PAF14318.1 hypothetical protein CHH59_09665 [Shouchella clausii]SPU21415.1 sporulation killing factor biosynthesis and export [Niallia circulans]